MEGNLENNDGVASEVVTDAASEIALGGTLPAPVRKNLFKALNRLCTAAVDYPVACLEGKAAEKRAETEGRINLLKASSNQIADKMDIDQEYARIAAEKYGQRIVQEQINLDQISDIALENIEKNKDQVDTSEQSISDDWLNAFEKEAVTKSSQDMKLLFGKVLANEIQHPSSFSIRTVKLLSQLDNEAAILFVRFCSASVSLRLGEFVHDGRVVSLKGSAAQNSLEQYGLSFDQLNILFEYGLIVSDYNCYMGYEAAIVKKDHVMATVFHQNKHYALVPIEPNQNISQLRLSGVALTKAGKELLKIVDIEPSQQYTSDLAQYFQQKKFRLVEVAP